MPDFSYEQGYTGNVAGVDEVGRGPWAGPVLAAAAIIDPKTFPSDLLGKIQDSKKLSPARREAIYQALEAGCPGVVFAYAQASVSEIDRLNILQASLLAMKRAVEALSVRPDYALIDGTHAPVLACPTETIVKGDQKCVSIAVASIVAKVTRDRLMTTLAQEFPGYGWERNAGYGTALHQQGLDTYGVTAHHRRSFAPILKRLAV